MIHLLLKLIGSVFVLIAAWWVLSWVIGIAVVAWVIIQANLQQLFKRKPAPSIGVGDFKPWEKQ